MTCYKRSLFWVACLLLSSFTPIAANNGPAALTTPLNGFGPSMVASMAQGTVVIAVECHTSDCPNDTSGMGIVILVCQPQKSPFHDSHGSSDSKPTKMKSTPFCGLNLVTQQPRNDLNDHPTSPQFSSQLPSCLTCLESPRGTVVCAMTGFLPDVDYLQRQIRVWREDLYMEQDDPSVSSPQLAQVMGQWIREYESMRDRPLGIQGMALGLSRSTRTAFRGGRLAAQQQQPEGAQMYTTDPSGQIRSWNGGATAMGGAQAMDIRKALHQRLQKLWTTKADASEMESGSRDTIGVLPKEALEVALGAFSDTIVDPAHSSKDTGGDRISESFEMDAFLLWQSQGKTGILSRIDPTQLTNILAQRG